MRPESPSSRLRRQLSLRRILLAVVAYYAVVSYQFLRIRPTLDQYPDWMATAVRIDTASSLPAEYLSYLLGATIGDWGTSVRYARPVTSTLVEALPWLAILVTAATVTTVAAVWAWRRREDPPAPTWVITALVYATAFLVGTFLLVGTGTQASGLFLQQAAATRDLPLLLGARRLLALGLIVGALIVTASGLLAATEPTTGSAGTAQVTDGGPDRRQE